MTYIGHVRNGMVVLPEGTPVEEGMAVRVELLAAPPAAEVAATPEADEGSTESLWAWLLSMAEMAERDPTPMPSDLAENHDHYAHGGPKR